MAEAVVIIVFLPAVPGPRCAARFYYRMLDTVQSPDEAWWTGEPAGPAGFGFSAMVAK
jgi:hypothetical protein